MKSEVKKREYCELDPEEWVESTEHPGYKMKVIKYGNCTIKVYRPELDKAERAKREAHVKRVAEKVLFDYYKRKGELEIEQRNNN